MNSLKLMFDVLEPGTDTVILTAGTEVSDEVLTLLAMLGADDVPCMYDTECPIVVILQPLLGE